jgi:hypothetical protein
VFEAERPKLVPYAGRFDGFHAVPASVSKTCLVRFDNNKYSVAASAVGRQVEVHAYADRIVIRQNGRIVAEHSRSFGRGHTAYDPWHYVPVLARKPGALRNGAPFKDWVLPAAMERVRRKLASADDGNRQMVLFAGLSGSILDAGVGTGRNFPFYPRNAKIVGIDLSPAMLARAARGRRAFTTRKSIDDLAFNHHSCAISGERDIF